MAVNVTGNLTLTAGDGLAGDVNLTKTTSLSFAGLAEDLVQSLNVGVAPPAAPTVTPGGSGGSLTAGTYYVKITYVTAEAESLPSAESAQQTVTTGQTLTITSPAASSPAYGYNVYLTPHNGASGSETGPQNSTPIPIGTNYVQSAAYSADSSPPATDATLTYSVALPISPAQVVYVKNTSSTQVITVKWTYQGGSLAKTIDLGPGSAVLIFEGGAISLAGVAAGGITALTLIASADGASVEYFLAG
jgi:hypothetical protein